MFNGKILRIQYFILTTMLAACLGCDSADSGANRQFDQGRQLAVEGRFEEALPVLLACQKAHPQGKQASRAGLFLGKVYLALNRNEEARAAWVHTVENFSTTLEGHKCRYKLAFLDMLEGNTPAALAGFRELAENPDGPNAAEARAMVTFLSQ